MTALAANGELVGRGAELRELAALLADPAVRLVTVTGLAGVGKTRLATELLHTLGDDSVPSAFVPLSAIGEPALVRDQVLAQLPGPADLAATVGERLWLRFGGARVVLVLDDIEPLAGAHEIITTMLDGYDQLQIVATSLVPLRARHEQVFRLAPLPLPDPATACADEPAVALFVQRAAASGVRLDTADLGAIAAVCRAVDGLPLAIELAAARARTIPPAILAAQLSGRRGAVLLHRDADGRPERHHSVTAALSWTYELLPPALQELLVQLSVFAGRFTIEAASAVVVPVRESLADLLDELSELIDRQLLDVTARADDPDSARFAIVPLARRFAAERLATLGTADEVAGRHARYFEHRCRDGVLPTPDEWPDLIVALDRAILEARLDDALQAAVGAAALLHVPAGASGLVHARLERLIDTAREDTGVAPGLLAQALVWSAAGSGPATSGADYSAWTRGRLEDALAAARRVGDVRLLLQALELVVDSLPVTLDIAGAVAAVAEGLELARRVGDEAGLARFETWAAMAARQAGDLPTARSLGASALRRGRATGDMIAQIYATVLLLALVPAGEQDVLGLPTLDALLTQCTTAGQTRPTLFVLSMLTRRELDAGQYRSAAAWAARRLALCGTREQVDPIAPAVSLLDLVLVAIGLGDLDSAVRLRESLTDLDAVLEVGVPPDLVAHYRAVTADLRHRVGAQRYDSLAADVRGRSLPEITRSALDYSRLVGLPPRPDPAARSGGREPVVARGPRLTPREREVLVELASGATNKQIALSLGLTAKTVMHHSVAIYQKLGVRGRAEATAWAYRAGIAPSTGTSTD